jgi:hypothetical protein
MATTRIAIDSQIVDLILDTPRALECLHLAAVAGRLLFLGLHIVRDQLAATGNEARRRRLLETYAALPKEEFPTHGFVLGVSRLGEATLGDGRESGISLHAVKTGGRGGMHDALIATTASGRADVLVTEDQDLRRKVTASAARCEVWSFGQLIDFARAAGAASRQSPP